MFVFCRNCRLERPEVGKVPENNVMHITYDRFQGRTGLTGNAKKI